jgi:hypothetical protein
MPTNTKPQMEYQLIIKSPRMLVFGIGQTDANKDRKVVLEMPIGALIKIAVGIALMVWGAPAVFGF